MLNYPARTIQKARETLDRIRREYGPDVVMSIRQVRDAYATSERVARLVSRILKGEEDEGALRDAGELLGASGGATHHAMDDGSHHFEWTTSEGIQKAKTFTAEEWREIIRKYVDPSVGGRGLSMLEVAIEHGLTRQDFEAIKSAYGLTKRHEPFRVEDIAENNTEELLGDQLALQRRSLKERFDRESLTQVRRLAAKWQAMQENLLNPFADIVASVVGKPLPKSREWKVPPTEGGYMVVYQCSDLHYGSFVDARLSSDPVGYDRQRAKDIFQKHAIEALRHGLRAYGPDLEYFLLYVGGDILHVDNEQGKTTSFRHTQDMDGLPDTLISEVVEMYVETVDDLLSRGITVHLSCVPGNHDSMHSRAMMAALWARYNDDGRVYFGNITSDYDFHVYGNNLLVGHHGHGVRSTAQLADVAMDWLDHQDYAISHRYAITGNLHHLKVEEAHGMVLLQQPSPTGSDRYHTRNGYRSRRATTAYYFSAFDGLLSMRYWQV